MSIGNTDSVSEQLIMDWPQLLQSALACHQTGRLAEAESFYRQVLQQQPRQHDALRLLGVLFRQRGELEMASRYLRQAVEARPNLAEAHHDLGFALFERREIAEAIRCYRRALELKPRFPEALHNLGNAHLAEWRWEDATRCFEQALECAPNQTESRSSLGWIEKHEAEMSALADYRERAARSPTASASDPVHSESGSPLLSRDLFPHLFNKLGLTGRGAEVGVQSGEFSEHLLRHWKGERLYSIDPWKEFPSAAYLDVANVPQSKHDALYLSTLRRLLKFESRSVVWRLTSREAVELLEEKSLDFCYLDADHSYPAVVDDIATWYPKIKRGGVLAGHDFIPDGTYPFGVFGVQKAVHEFVRAKSLRLFTTAEPKFASWFIIKTSGD